MTTEPTDYPNQRGNNAWDNDAVWWLLDFPDVAKEFDLHNLFECARRQPKRLETDSARVGRAAWFCGRHGVEQLEVFDPKIGKTIVRLRRTDPDAPEYPDYGDSPPTAFEPNAADRAAAERLLTLLPSYESMLRASGKTGSTVFTYVDRAERFLKRVLAIA